MRFTNCFYYLTFIKLLLNNTPLTDLGDISSNARGMAMKFKGDDGINYILELRPDLAANYEEEIPTTGFAECEDPYGEVQRENALSCLNNNKS